MPKCQPIANKLVERVEIKHHETGNLDMRSYYPLILTGKI